MTDLDEFLREEGFIDSIEVISFKSIPPQLVGLVGGGGGRVYLVNEMRDLADGTELGELRVVSGRVASQSGIIERFSGGVVTSLNLLASPVNGWVSGIGITLDSSRLIVTAGDAPFSVFLSYGDVVRGRSEFPLEEYRQVSGSLEIEETPRRAR